MPVRPPTFRPKGREPGHHQRAEPPWRKWYKTARWQALRFATFLRDLFKCQMCGRLEADTSKLVCDHRVPHRGSEKLFFDPSNLWTLCKRCHDTAKRNEEQATKHHQGIWY